MSVSSQPTALNEKLAGLAKDLTQEAPRSPRETLGGFVIAARTLDKCRALLNGTIGDYLFAQFMDNLFFEFSGISAEDFKAFVATDASDQEVDVWIRKHSREMSDLERVKWNNACRSTTPRDMPDRFQLYMESYIEENLPKNRPVIHVFDIFDIEEGRL